MLLDNIPSPDGGGTIEELSFTSPNGSFYCESFSSVRKWLSPSGTTKLSSLLKLELCYLSTGGSQWFQMADDED